MGIIRFGYTKDHCFNHPQINIELAMKSASGLLCSFTIIAGNTNDSKHFKDVFSQIQSFLSLDTLVIFDAGCTSTRMARLWLRSTTF